MSILTVQRAFSFGEVSPAVAARADLPFYSQALKTCRNWIVQREGGVTNRSGTQFLSEVKDSDDRCYFLTYIANDGTSYEIEAGPLYFRFYKNGVRVAVSGLSAWDSVAGTYVVGSLVSRSGTNYYCIQLNTFVFPRDPATEPTYWYPLTGTIFEIPTPYATTDLPNLRTSAAIDDRMTLVDGAHTIRELRRTSDTGWLLVEPAVVPAIPNVTNLTQGGSGGAATIWTVTSIDLGTGEESLGVVVTSGDDPNTTPVDLTWTAAIGAGSYRVYRTSGALSGVVGYVATVKAPGAAFTDDVLDEAMDFAQQPPVNRAYLFQIAGGSGAGFGQEAGGPVSVTFFKQRQVFGGSSLQPEGIYASQVASRLNFAISNPLEDDDAISFRIRGSMATNRQSNTVRYVIEVDDLIILTASAAWRVSGDVDGAFGPWSVNPVLVATHGASAASPVVVGRRLIYVQARGNTMRELRFAQEAGGFDGRDLTVLSSHLLKGYTVSQLAYQEIPFSVVWAIRSDGVLLGLTYLTESDTVGWHRHTTKNGAFEDIAIVPEGEEDVVYVFVNRTINGQTRRYLERFASRTISNVNTDAKFLDSHITYSGASTTAITGLSHLEGEEVWALADGSKQGPFTVTGGAITLSHAASVVCVGLKIEGADIELLEFIGVGRKKRIGAVDVRVLETRGLSAGQTADTLREFTAPAPAAYGSAPGVFSGLISAGIPASWTDHGPVLIRQNEPYPATILSIMPQGEVA